MPNMTGYHHLKDTPNHCHGQKSHRIDDSKREHFRIQPSITLIKRKHGRMRDSAVRLEGGQEILYSFRRRSMTAYEMYKGDFGITSNGSTSEDVSKPGRLFAVINYCSIQYIPPPSSSLMKIPESQFLYKKRWYHVYGFSAIV